ncbi:hypothetical protein YQE_10380, partial [Dendroctonus ponderosae]
ECSVATNTSPKDQNYGHGYPKNTQLSPVSRNNHIHYSGEGAGIPDRRHNLIQNPPDRRHSMQQNYHGVNDRRLMPGLADRRHISPPLHINICENNSGPTENIHPRGLMEYPQRMSARGNRNNIGSPPLRRPRYRDRNDFTHSHHQQFIPSPPPVAHAHPHQNTVMVDLN